MREQLKKSGFANFEEYVNSAGFKETFKLLNSQNKIDGGKNSNIYLLKLGETNFILKKHNDHQTNNRQKNEKKISDKARKFLSENIVIPEIYYASEDSSFSIMEYIPLKKIKSYKKISEVLKTFSEEKQKELGKELGMFFKNFNQSEVIVKNYGVSYENPVTNKEFLLEKLACFLDLSIETFLFISHGDIHESNIQFTKDNKIVILDWELGDFRNYSNDVNSLLIYNELSAFNSEFSKAYNKNNIYKKTEITTFGKKIEFYAPNNNKMDLFEKLHETIKLLYDLKLTQAIEKMKNLKQKNKTGSLNIDFMKITEMLLSHSKFKKEVRGFTAKKALIKLKLSNKYKKGFLKFGVWKKINVLMQKIEDIDRFIYVKTGKELNLDITTKKIRKITKTSFGNSFKDENCND